MTMTRALTAVALIALALLALALGGGFLIGAVKLLTDEQWPEW